MIELNWLTGVFKALATINFIPACTFQEPTSSNNKLINY